MVQVHNLYWHLTHKLYIKSNWKVRSTWPTLAQVHSSPNSSTPTRACEGRSTWIWTWVDLRKNCMRRPCTKFSEAELARRGKLGARPLSAVLYKSLLRTPHFELDLMLVHRTLHLTYILSTSKGWMYVVIAWLDKNQINIEIGLLGQLLECLDLSLLILDDRPRLKFPPCIGGNLQELELNFCVDGR